MDEKQFKQQLEALQKDHEHGATELARRALELMAMSARAVAIVASTEEAMAILWHRALQTEEIRPGTAPIANLVSRWRSMLPEQQEQPLAYATRAWAASAEWLSENSREAVANTAMMAADTIKDGMTVMTHSLSSTLVATFRALSTRQDLHVIVTESRPQNEGYWLAKVLSELNIRCTLITDAQMGLMVRRADLVMVGADSLLRDGSIVNKVGTYLLALAARNHQVPVYALCESFKRLPDAVTSVEPELMDPREIGAPRYLHCTVQNAYYEVTPSELITAWVDEFGVHRQRETRGTPQRVR